MPLGDLTSENRVIRTACNLCQNYCGLLAHVQGGKVVKLEGDPANPRNRGHACAKGLSGHLSLYSPRRISHPLMRTNPDKGNDVDPGWKEIGWDEAIEMLAEKIRRIQANPKGFERKILFVSFDIWSRQNGPMAAWLYAAQALQGPLGADCFCGNAVHPPVIMNLAAFEHTPDAEYAKYILLIGAQSGSIIHYDTMNTARHIAEKRPGGVKVVVVDPVCSYAAAKAEEWVPIRPGTDAAFIMSLANLLINKEKLYDAQYLKNRTNAPYLVSPDGLYHREKESGLPMVWDSADAVAKPFSSNVRDFALEGSYVVDGVECKPSFQLIKEATGKYDPGYASEITSIPAETIGRIAKEIGTAASIDSTIEVDGVSLPYRPVSVVWYRGLSAHRHAFLTGLAAMMIPTLLGAIQVPGAITGEPRMPHYVDKDGLLAAKRPRQRSSLLGGPYPPREVNKPRNLEVSELFPVAIYSKPMIIPALLDPGKFGLGGDVLPELLIVYKDNAVGNTYSPETVMEAFKKIPFAVSFSMEMDETSKVADLIIPDVHHLERLGDGLFSYIDEPGYWYAAKPAVRPPFDGAYGDLVSIDQVLLEVAKRAGFLDECYKVMNDIWGIKGTQYELDPGREYPYTELIDRRLKASLGADHGMDWLLSKEGGLLVWGAKPEERYPGAFREGRVHLYYEFMTRAGEQVKAVTDGMGLPWDSSDYEAIPEWKPCFAYSERNEEFDLYVTNYKVPVQIHGIGRSNPVLRQLVEHHNLDTVLMNRGTAERKGIVDGDEVLIQTAKGRSSKAVVALTERVHPEVIATMQHKISRGADFNSLLNLDNDTLDFLSCAVDSCLLAKVAKA